MKKYVNNGHKMVCIEFEDGTAQFLKRGQFIATAKKVTKLPKEVLVQDVIKNRKVSKVLKKEEK